jgi:hypothetical protein
MATNQRPQGNLDGWEVQCPLDLEHEVVRTRR